MQFELVLSRDWTSISELRAESTRHNSLGSYFCKKGSNFYSLAAR